MLVKHQKEKFATYDNLSGDAKKELRKSLVSEQRGICCYCMSPLVVDERMMKIEHFKCQEDHPDLQLDYANLLGACMGNSKKKGELHCDSHKGNLTLHFNPANRTFAIERLIVYKTDGTITSTNQQLAQDINKVLNLNSMKLKNSRKAALGGLMLILGKRGNGTVPDATLRRLLQRYEGSGHVGDLDPFCMVMVYYIKRRLRIS